MYSVFEEHLQTDMGKTLVRQYDIDLRLTVRYLGVPILGSYMFGDNKAVVDSSMVPHSKLNKRHTALLYHRVREAICAKIFKFFHIYITENLSDIIIFCPKN